MNLYRCPHCGHEVRTVAADATVFHRCPKRDRQWRNYVLVGPVERNTR